MDIKFTRIVRTQSSEQYFVWCKGESLGQLDLHYDSIIHATLYVLDDTFTIDEIAKVLSFFEDSFIPDDPRYKDFVVSVYQGRDIGALVSEKIKLWEKTGRK